MRFVSSSPTSILEDSQHPCQDRGRAGVGITATLFLLSYSDSSFMPDVLLSFASWLHRDSKVVYAQWKTQPCTLGYSINIIEQQGKLIT